MEFEPLLRIPGVVRSCISRCIAYIQEKLVVKNLFSTNYRQPLCDELFRLYKCGKPAAIRFC